MLEKAHTNITTIHYTKVALPFLFLSRGTHGDRDRLGDLSIICSLLSLLSKRCRQTLSYDALGPLTPSLTPTVTSG